jgi:hypothetical protein
LKPGRGGCVGDLADAVDELCDDQSEATTPVSESRWVFFRSAAVASGAGTRVAGAGRGGLLPLTPVEVEGTGERE